MSTGSLCSKHGDGPDCTLQIKLAAGGAADTSDSSRSGGSSSGTDSDQGGNDAAAYEAALDAHRSSQVLLVKLLYLLASCWSKGAGDFIRPTHSCRCSSLARMRLLAATATATAAASPEPLAGTARRRQQKTFQLTKQRWTRKKNRR